MKILFDNVDFSSNSGPNGFGKKLASVLVKDNIIFTTPPYNVDVQLTFIESRLGKRAPTVHRLDGVYFNSAQDWKSLNSSIKRTFDIADAVIYQTEFDKSLVNKFFGDRDNGHVINNGTDLAAISMIDVAKLPEIDEKYDVVWACASQWRPHKRLSENVRYFQEHRGMKDCLLVAGELNVPAGSINDNLRDVYFLGNLVWEDLISLYKRAKKFIHLSLCDHCPNVVVDAHACGCEIICSSTGGTEEIAGLNSTVIIEPEWNFEPFALYEPAKLDFTKFRQGKFRSNHDIVEVAKHYQEILESVRRK